MTVAAADVSSGMIALRPESPEGFVVDGGDLADDFHVTLFFLGNQVTGRIRQDAEDAVSAIARGADGPFAVQVAGYGVLGDEGAVVLFLNGAGMAQIKEGLDGAFANPDVPDQHMPWIPHMTLGYGIDAEEAKGFVGAEFTIDAISVDVGDEQRRFELAMTDSDAGGKVAVMTGVIDTFKDAIDSGAVKAKRDELGLSQTDVAAKLGISSAAISRWEAGNRIPREDLAREFLEVLGIEFQDGEDDGDCPEGQHRMPDGSCMDDEDMPGAGGRYGIKGVATLEGTWTGDGRMFKEGGLSWPDPQETDIPFQWQKETSHGGDNDVTVNIGRLTAIERDGDEITYEGFIDTGSEDGAEYVRRRRAAGSNGGVSIVADDPENGDMEIVWEGEEPVGVVFHTGRIRALTAVDVPAFAEAYVELTGELEPVTASGWGAPSETRYEVFYGETFVSESPWDGSTSRFTDEQWRRATAACDEGRGETAKEQCFLPHHEPGGAVSRAGVHAAAARFNQTQASAEAKSRAKTHLRNHYTRDLNEEPPEVLTASAGFIPAANGERSDLRAEVGELASLPEELQGLSALIAAASTITIDDAPPREWFDEPKELPAAGAITVTDDGRLYGLLAPKQVAHRSFRDRRVEVPTGNVDYSRWMNRQTITQDGERVMAGPITMQCGHASTNPLFRSNPDNAVQHYDNSCSVVATARVGENAHGVWIAGALLPDVGRAQVARMMACQLSGDWQDHRESPGNREFVAALLVPVPGFPVGESSASLRMDEGFLVASASPVQWYAAGAVPEEEEEDVSEKEEVAVTETDESEQASPEGLEENGQEDDPLADLPDPAELAAEKKELRAAEIARMNAELGLDSPDDTRTKGE